MQRCTTTVSHTPDAAAIALEHRQGDIASRLEGDLQRHADGQRLADRTDDVLSHPETDRRSLSRS